MRLYFCTLRRVHSWTILDMTNENVINCHFFHRTRFFHCAKVFILFFRVFPYLIDKRKKNDEEMYTLMRKID